MKLALTFALLLVVDVADVADVVHVAQAAEAACPAAATDAAKKRFPEAAVTQCLAKGERFEVKLEKKDHARVEVAVSATGEILAVEEVVPVASLPEAVTKAFAAKYPKAVARKVEKITKPSGTAYEIEFLAGKERREATFQENGAFVEEE